MKTKCGEIVWIGYSEWKYTEYNITPRFLSWTTKLIIEMGQTRRQGISQKFMCLVAVMLILKCIWDTNYIPSRNYINSCMSIEVQGEH